jgi:hypothetical protein
MAKADIILEENRINVLGGEGHEGVDGVERGDLEITTEMGGMPDVRLNAKWANLTLGGGGASGSEGDVKLLDRDGNNRMTLTAEDNNSPTDGMRAWIDGGTGRLELGENDAHDVHTPLIWLDGPDGELGIADDPPTPNSPVISLNAADADVTVGANSDEPGRVSLLAEDASIKIAAEVDDDRYQSEFRMDDGDESGGIRLRTMAEGNDYPAGNVALFDSAGSSGIKLLGESATLRLGYSYVTEGENAAEGPTADINFLPKGVGQSGQIVLDDGDVSVEGLSGEEVPSTVFGIRASEGRLEVADMSDNTPRLTLEPDGEFATLRLGYSPFKEGDGVTLGRYVGEGQRGQIVLDDGDMGGDTAEFGVRASEGRLEVAEMSDTNPRLTLEQTGRLKVLDGDRNAVFTVDPDSKVVEIPESWKIKSGDDTVLG